MALKAAVNANDMECGLRIHSALRSGDIEGDVHLLSALIAFYGAFGHIEAAESIFESVAVAEHQSIATVNAMMTAYIQCDGHHAAVQLFARTKAAGSVQPDRVTLATALRACGRSAVLVDFGRALHFENEQNGLLSDPEAVAHLLAMYSIGGTAAECEAVFAAFGRFEGRCPSTKMAVAISRAMLRCYAKRGDVAKSQSFYSEMAADKIQGDAARRDPAVFVAMFHCAGNAGDVRWAKELWGDLDDELKSDHFVAAAFVGSLAESGALAEAMDFMAENDCRRCPKGWLSVLSAARNHCDVGTGQRAYGRIKELFAGDAVTMSAASVSMSHLFASQMEFAKQLEIREEMKENGWTPSPPSAEVVVDGKVAVFQSGAGIDAVYFNNDREAMHRRIDGKLKALCSDIGFEHDLSRLTRRCDTDGAKENELRRHAEKQAVAFSLEHSAEGTPIVIGLRGMRMCSDCHRFMAAVAQRTRRRITVSDPNRVHLFAAS